MITGDNNGPSPIPRRLRIAQVVTLISPDGAFGGPLRVAENQSEALRDAGHHVEIFAGYRGFSNPPTNLKSVPIRAFPVKNIVPGSGFAGTFSPKLLKELRARISEFDVVHVHMARDFVTLPAARIVALSKVPLVIQTHGMIDQSRHPLAVPLDLILTRPVLRAASVAFYLTAREEADLRSVSRSSMNLVPLANGVPYSHLRPDADRQSVLFLARLHPRKRPLEFVKAAIRLAGKYPDADFCLVGPDEGEESSIRAAIASARLEDRIRLEGALAPERTLDRMSRSSIYVLPSLDEPFPMTVLEAMSIGLPAIVTDSCGLAVPLSENGAGVVVGSSSESLVNAIDGLLGNTHMRDRVSKNAKRLVRDQFSMQKIAADLEAGYRSAIAHPRRRNRSSDDLDLS